MIKDQTFIDLESSLVAVLTPKWVAMTKRITVPLSDAIQEGDFPKVAELLEGIQGSKLYKGKSKEITLLFTGGLYFGASRISQRGIGLYIQSDLEVLAMVGIAYTQFKAMLDYAEGVARLRFTEVAVKIRDRLDFESTANLEKSEVGVQKINPINVIDLLNQAAVSIGKNAIDVASSLQMSRLAQYGFVSEANARGITTYVINEVLDGRTCPVCRQMHKKEFQVKDALQKLDALIRVTAPEDLKALAPFPKQDAESIKALSTMTSEQLRSHGFDTPPYHPLCRGLLSTKANTPALESPQPQPLVEGLGTEPKINPRVAQFLDSTAAGALTFEAREALIALSVGVEDYQKIPKEIRDLIDLA